MESDGDCFEDAQRVSSNTVSPEPKRHCTDTMTPPLFESPTDYESSSSDGAFFPSERSSASAQSGCVRYPSQDSGQCFSPLAEVENSNYSLDEPEVHTPEIPDVMAEVTDSDGEREQVGALLVSRCCERQCLFHLTARDVLTARERYFSLKRNEQRQWLMDKVHENSHEIEKGKITVTFTLSGQDVCRASWCKVFKISERKISRLVKSVSSGTLVAEHGNKGKRRANTKSESAKAWMAKYFHLVGDKMPHKSQIHLPSWETQKDIYMRYTEDMTLQGIAASEIVSLSMFYKIWGENFAYVVIPEVRIIYCWWLWVSYHLTPILATPCLCSNPHQSTAALLVSILEYI